MIASGQWLSLVGWLAVTFVVAAIGGLGSADAPVVYQQMVRPWWAPPGWLFGPAWGVLYLLIGVAAWLVWCERDSQPVGPALAWFGAQLVANALWSWLYFAWRQGAWSFVEVLVFWVLLAVTVVMFWRIRPLAGMLMLPCLAWVSFAAALNYATWRLNPDLLR